MIHMETKRLLMWPVAAADEPDLHRLHCDPFVVNSIQDGKVPTLEETRSKLGGYIAHWQKHGWGLFAVHEKEPGGVDARFVGRCGIRLFDDGVSAEIASCFFEAASGRGLGPEAGIGVLRFAFETIGLPRVVGVVRHGNERSLRSNEKRGFRYVEDQRHYGKMMHFLEITAEEFQARHGMLQAAA